MASIKAIAAIALTLMIAVPIGLGYAFASETVTDTDYEVTETKNITSQLENSTMASKTSYTNNPANNQAVFIGQTSYDEGTTVEQTSVSLAAVDYVADNVATSSWPIYTWSSAVKSISGPTATTYYVGNNSTYATIGSPNTDPSASITGISIQLEIETWPDRTDPGLNTEISFYTATSTTTVYAPVTASIVQSSNNGTYHIEAVDHFGIIYEVDDVTGWKLASVESLRVLSYVHTTYYSAISSSITAYEYVTPSATAYYVDVANSTADKYFGVSSGTIVTYNNGTVHIGDAVVSNVAGVHFSIAKNISSDGLTYYSAPTTGGYGNPAQGWYIPRLISDTSDADYSDWMSAYWFNKQSNMAVNMWVYLPEGEAVSLTPVNHLTVNNGAEVSNSVKLLYGTVGTQTGLFVKKATDSSYTYLGTYHYALVSFTETGIGVGTSPYLPAAYDNYTLFTSWSMTYDYLGGTPPYAPSVPFTYIKIDLPNDYDGTSFRVDALSVTGEPIAATVDLTWDWFQKFPETSLELTFKSIGAHGTSLGVAGTEYAVTSGTVSFTDLGGTARTVTLLGSSIKVLYDSDDGYYDVYIGGYLVKQNATDETLVFNGTWSVVMTASKLSTVTTSSQQWTPGEFAFGTEDFAACVLLVAGACLIGLGMTGKRSGIKMGVLLLICGGAALIALTII